MRPRVGLYFHARKSSGGIFQYSLMLLDAFTVQRESLPFDIIVFCASPDYPHEKYRLAGWQIVELVSPVIRFAEKYLHETIISYGKKLLFFIEGLVAPKSSTKTNNRLARIFRQHHIDVVIYPSPRRESFESGIPAISVVHDIQHRLQPEFPELSSFGEYSRREYIYQNMMQKSVAIISESAIGKEDIIREYGIEADKIKILPYIPAISIPSGDSRHEMENVRTKYNLPERFIFYPAQFWPHKNHFRLVQAIELIYQQYGIRIPVILSGSTQKSWREYQRIFSFVKEKGLSDIIRYLQYIPSQELPYFYKSATMLVMPTFFGPTNIPILEAFALGCPVVTSDIRGVREQVGNAALLASPNDSSDIAAKILTVWLNEDVRATLITRGMKVNDRWTLIHFSERAKEIIAPIVDAIHQQKTDREEKRSN